MRWTPDNRVVVTGLGAMTPLGGALDHLLNAVMKSADARSFAASLSPSADLPYEGNPIPLLRTQVGSPSELGGLRPPFPDRFTLLAISAADNAMASSRLNSEDPRGNHRIGFVGTTAYGPRETVEKYLRTFLREGPGGVSPINFSRTVSNSIVGEVSRRYHLYGSSTMLIGASAVEYALDLLFGNRADGILCLGVDTINEATLWSYSQAGMLSNGLILGEASAALVLERQEVAKRRSASPLARVLATASCFSASATQRMVELDSDSIYSCFAQALERAEMEPEEADFLLSLDNGDSTLRAAESQAIERLFDERLAIFRPKCTFGETFGSAETLSTVMASLLIATRALGRRGLVCSCHLGGSVSVVVLESPFP